METDSPDALPKAESSCLYFVEGDPSLPEEGNAAQNLDSAPNDNKSNASSDSMKLPKEALNHPANIHTVCLLLHDYLTDLPFHRTMENQDPNQLRFQVLGYVARLLDMKNEVLAELSYRNAVRLFSYTGSKLLLERGK